MKVHTHTHRERERERERELFQPFFHSLQYRLPLKKKVLPLWGLLFSTGKEETVNKQKNKGIT
jgi:hypothetical protein